MIWSWLLLATLILTPLLVLGEAIRRWRRRPALAFVLIWLGVLMLVWLALPFFCTFRLASVRVIAINRIDEIAKAARAYRADHELRLPPAALRDSAGRPLLSWRVLLLPYLGREDLHWRFHLDEPWDSSHNRALLPHMPEVYAPPSVIDTRRDPFTTYYQVFVGKGAAFEGAEGLRVPADFPDGTEETILVAEAGEAVPWTKPADLRYDPDGPLPPLGGVFPERRLRLFGQELPPCFMVALVSTRVRLVSSDTSERAIRAAVTRNGGERKPPDW